MGLTRARVYQLLNEINDIMAVRWPNGRHQMYELREKLVSESKSMDSPPDLQQFFAAIELFYPGSRRGAAGPLEHHARRGRRGRDGRQHGRRAGHWSPRSRKASAMQAGTSLRGSGIRSILDLAGAAG